MYGSSLKFANSFKYIIHIICNSRYDYDAMSAKLEIYIYIPLFYIGPVVTRNTL